MPRPRIDLDAEIKRILDHVAELPPESASPIEHYNRGANDALNLLRYFERTASRVKTYAAPYQRHLARLSSFVLLAHVEAFERFVKELAAACVDHAGTLVLDDRLSVFNPQARAVAAHFHADTLGRALCEGETWLDSDAINRRFGRLLAKPFSEPDFKFFPTGKDPDAWRRGTIDVLWQLRHAIVHNVGVVTKSDAAKLRLLRRAATDAPKLLTPTAADVRYAKQFLDELAHWANGRVAARLADLLTQLYADDATLFAPGDRARELAQLFRVPVNVAGVSASP